MAKIRRGRTPAPPVRGEKGAAPSRPSLQAAPRLPKPSQLLREKLALMKRRREDPQPVDPFRIALHPPAVMKAVRKEGAQMAMDDFGGSLQWARTGVASAFAEGQVFLGYPELAILSQRAEYRRAVEVLATEMTRKWIRVTAKGDDVDKSEEVVELTDEMRRADVQGATCKALEHDGFFGRGHVYVDTGETDNRPELMTPIAGADGRPDPAKIKVGSLRGFRAIEPVWCYPTSYNADDPLREDWYNPTRWFVQGKQLHVSRLQLFVGHPVSDLLKPAYSFGGLPLTQMIKPYVDNWLRNRQSVADIMNNYSVAVLLTNLAASLAPEDGGADLFDRVELFNNLRDNQGTMVLDKDTEDFKNVSTPLSTLDVLQAQSLEHICAVTGIPVVKYTGIQPAGLNADSEGVIRVFYDLIAALQERQLRKQVQFMFECCQINLWGKVDEDLTWRFEPLQELNEQELAEVEAKEAETDVKLITAGVLHPEEVRQRLASKEDSPYAALDVDDVPEIDLDDEEGDEDQMKDAA